MINTFNDLLKALQTLSVEALEDEVATFDENQGAFYFPKYELKLDTNQKPFLAFAEED